MNLELQKAKQEAELAKMKAQIDQLKGGGQAQGNATGTECRACPPESRRSRCSAGIVGGACSDDERHHQ